VLLPLLLLAVASAAEKRNQMPHAKRGRRIAQVFSRLFVHRPPLAVLLDRELGSLALMVSVVVTLLS
jgi:hypothetical protein